MIVRIFSCVSLSSLILGGGGPPHASRFPRPVILPLPHSICGVDLGTCCTGISSRPILGASVSGAGDVNGDGYPDVIVGAPGSDEYGTDTGSALVVSGRNGNVVHSFYGAVPDGDFGIAVSGAGDVDADGRDDLLVGAQYHDVGASNTGTVFVYSGRTGSLLYSRHGTNASDHLGQSVSEIGDLNGDGRDDFIAGGRVLARVYSGIDGSVLYPYSGPYAFGTSVSGAGDVNNDGTNDFIIGDPNDDSCVSNGGIARVYSGSTGAVIRTFCGQVAWDQLGEVVSGAGDVNADGFDDIVLGGSITSSHFGEIWVYSGSNGSLLYNFTGQVANERYGESVSGAGDVNGDGFDDFIVGAINYESGGETVGAAWVYSGANGSILHFLYGENEAGQLDYFGSSVSGAGDVDKDGNDDFIIGVPGEDDGVGCAVIFAGGP